MYPQLSFRFTNVKQFQFDLLCGEGLDEQVELPGQLLVGPDDTDHSWLWRQSSCHPCWPGKKFGLGYIRVSNVIVLEIAAFKLVS